MKKFILPMLLLLSAPFAQAQLPGTNNPTFNPADTVNRGYWSGIVGGSVTCTAIQADGKIIVAGDFTAYDDNTVNHLIRLHPDGRLDNSFQSGTGFSASGGFRVNCMAIRPDGKIVLGGKFTRYNGTNLGHMVQLNPDGSVDASFLPGFSDPVHCLAIQPDGKIVAGGDFTSLNSTSVFRIARLNTDGTRDVSFTASNFNGRVRSLVLQPDGKILTGGDFSTYGGTSRGRIARLRPNGSLDMTFNPGTAFDNPVYCLALQPDGKVIAGGDFQTFNGSGKQRIARIDSNGVLDLTFLPASGFNRPVYSLSLLPDGSVLAAGSFTVFGGTANINRLTKLDGSGVRVPGFQIGTGSNDTVWTVTALADGKILIGGRYSYFNDYSSENRVMRLLGDGQKDYSFNRGSGYDRTFSAVAVQPDGKFFAVGGFTSHNGTGPIRNLARFLPDGIVDSTFRYGNGFNATPTVLCLQPDGKVLAAGSFTSVDGFSRIGLVRLNADGTVDTGFNPGTGTPGSAPVMAIAVQTDGKIILAGQFQSFNGTPCNRICRLLPDGSFDATFNIGSGFDATANRVLVQPDGKILVTGAFFVFNGANRDKIARLNADGTLDTGFNPGYGFNSTISDFKLQPDGKILVSGSFTMYNEIAVPRFVRLNPDAGIDAGFVPGTGFMSGSNTSYAIRFDIQADGKIIAIGSFTHYNGVERNRIARILPDGGIDPSFKSDPSFSNSVSILALQGNDKALVAGNFTSFNGATRNRMARVNAGDCSQTGTLDTTACGTFTLAGITYTTGGTYTQNVPTAHGCDSIVTLNLVLNRPTAFDTTASVCDSFTLNGQTYSTSGTYTQTRTNAAGCDSVITLHLSVNSRRVTLTQTACDSYTLNSQTYTTSGSYTQTYSTVTGCDSLITLNLTIKRSSARTLNASNCGNYTLNGQTYTASGTYTQTRTNAAGCDSVITLNLTVNRPGTSTINAVACKRYVLNGQTYTASGTYTQVRQNAAGCDSTITLTLTINGNVTVTRSGTTLTASAGGSYQWFNCATNMPIAGATERIYTVTGNGSYAVQFTQGGCVDTSQCYTYTTLDLDETPLIEQLSVYPNPSSGRVTLDARHVTGTLELELFNAVGQKVSFTRLNHEGLFELEIEGPPGIYVLSVSNGNRRSNLKLLKQ